MANHGYAPYEESSFKAALRLLGGGLRGLGAVPQGANFGQGLGAGFNASNNASNAARAAAEQYAMKRQEQERQAAQDEIRNKYLDALTKRAERPEKPAPPPKTPTNVLDMTPDQFRLYKERKTQLRPPKIAKPEKPPKPDKIPRRIPVGLKKTEGDLLREIDWTPSNPKEQAAFPEFQQHLVDIMTGRAGYDSPALRRAAQARLNAIQREGR